MAFSRFCYHTPTTNLLKISGKSEILPELYEIKTESQIKLTYESCKLARFVLNCVAEHIKVGMTTDEINEFAHELIISKGAYPSPLNFGGKHGNIMIVAEGCN